MTAHKNISITCDGVPGDPYGCSWREYYGTRDTFAGVREQAADEGWTRRNGKDMCPDHSKPGEAGR